jgi:hypothetical protein
LMQTGCCHRAVFVQTDFIIRRQSGICFSWHRRLC